MLVPSDIYIYIYIHTHTLSIYACIYLSICLYIYICIAAQADIAKHIFEDPRLQRSDDWLCRHAGLGMALSSFWVYEGFRGFRVQGFRGQGFRV